MHASVLYSVYFIIYIIITNEIKITKVFEGIMLSNKVVRKFCLEAFYQIISNERIYNI